jgi:hypothetical protein
VQLPHAAKKGQCVHLLLLLVLCETGALYVISQILIQAVQGLEILFFLPGYQSMPNACHEYQETTETLVGY